MDALFKVCIYGCRIAGRVGSDPAEGMDVCLLWFLCVD